MARKIAYLFGAGATQGAAFSINPDININTGAIQETIRNNKNHVVDDVNVWNELIGDKRDIEHLISVLECQYQYSRSNEIRDLYHDALVELTKKIPTPLPENLYTILVDIHLNLKKELDEDLLCFMTLNYEDLLEKSIIEHFGGMHVNYGIRTIPVNKSSDNEINVLKLHGSFNWSNERPIEVKDIFALNSKNTLWIPPGVDKKKENYPFNLLWGKAIEYLMECDILRVIGCSLSRNDWGLIPIIYTVQKFMGKEKLKIEVIDFFNIGKTIKKNYEYLSVEDITKLDEILYYHTRRLSHLTSEDLEIYLSKEEGQSAKINPFELWLDAKIESLIYKDREGDPLNISERAKFASEFYNKNL